MSLVNKEVIRLFAYLFDTFYLVLSDNCYFLSLLFLSFNLFKSFYMYYEIYLELYHPNHFMISICPTSVSSIFLLP